MSTEPGAPLAAVTVVSLATNLPGPVAAARLVSLGASVVKVEPPAGDPLGMVVPSWYDELIAGQEVITLDLKDPGGRSTLETELASADVLLTSMRPSASARLGLVDAVARHGLVLVEIVGYEGERAEEAGHDLTYQAARGMVLPPAMPLVPVVDLLGAEHAVSAVLAGLRRRDLGEAAPHLRVVLDEVAGQASATVRHGLTGPPGMPSAGRRRPTASTPLRTDTSRSPR
jgi:crotonobetainyl-CoA:carnitine CoA-transferase CaiB-like acyl-CoA transferase